MASIKDLITSPTPDSVVASRSILNQARRDHLSYHPSPDDWQDEILYFLLPDRFSDDKDRPMLTRDEIRTLRTASSRPGWNWKNWADSGRLWQGGTIAGITKRLPYLQALGISAIWIGPLLKQRNHLDTYHGYGIQDFLEVDPRFGTRQESARSRPGRPRQGNSRDPRHHSESHRRRLGLPAARRATRRVLQRTRRIVIGRGSTAVRPLRIPRAGSLHGEMWSRRVLRPIRMPLPRETRLCGPASSRTRRGSPGPARATLAPETRMIPTRSFAGPISSL